jgi:hypothetical protein
MGLNEMSMNLNVKAERAVTVNKTGKRSMQHTSFQLWQTPTNETHNMLASSDVRQAYIDWVKSKNLVEKIPVFADDDALCEGDPIGYEEVNWALEHVAEFEAWIKDCEEEGCQLPLPKGRGL